jgi:hypothetical protein
MPHRSWPPELASPQSPLGQLQRGHGAIARTILSGVVPGATEMVFGCIGVDPRWDRQLDARADYYAQLMPAVGIGIDEVVELVAIDEAEAFEVDPGACLALDVLLRCAARDHTDALSATRGYVARGRYWSRAVDALVYGPSWTEPRSEWRERVQGIHETIKSRWSAPDALIEAFRDDCHVDMRRTPWREWAGEDPELGEALEKAPPSSQSQPRPRERIRGRSTDQLLALTDPGYLRVVAQKLAKRNGRRDIEAMLRVAHDPAAPMHAAAVSALAAQQDVEVLPAVLALTEATRPLAVRALLFRAFGALPYQATHDTAVQWLSGSDMSRRRAAASAMGTHAIPADIPLLRQLLTSELDAGVSGEQYLVCSYADALGRHPALGPYPELDRAFLEMPYSYGRHYVVDALSVSDPRFSGTRAVDCLWDAEPLIRAAAASAADVESPEATARLGALATDPAEEPIVRSAARRP